MKTITLFLLTLFVLFPLSPVFANSPLTDAGRGEYWLNKYGEIPENPLKTRIQGIFTKIRLAADRKIGVEPVLRIINYNGLPWAQALQDGSIILTKNALEFCYRDRDHEKGDARIAFILGHELAHQLAGDFWHYAFFQAMNRIDTVDTLHKTLSGIKELVRDSENFITKEIRADQMGIIYASIAGFRTDYLITKETNFFLETARAMDITKINFKPTPEQRAAATITRLKEVSRGLPLFSMGLLAYRIGWFQEAIELLEVFKKTYPGREVYNNLGAAYLRMALKNLIWKGEGTFPFKLSITADLTTTANSIQISTRSGLKGSRYKKHIDKAIHNLEKAIESDPYYPLSKNNLGSAYILEERYHDAIGQFDAALKLNPSDGEALNNRGIAYFLLGQKIKTPLDNKSAADFMKAEEILTNSPVPVYNLSILYKKLGKMKESEREFARYSKMVSRNNPFPVDNGIDTLKTSLSANIGTGIGERTPKNLTEKGWTRVYEGSTISLYNHPGKRAGIMSKQGRVRLILRDAHNIRGFPVSKDNLLKSVAEPDKKIVAPGSEVWLYNEGLGLAVNNKIIRKGFVFAVSGM